MRATFSGALVFVLLTLPISAQNFENQSAWRDAMILTFAYFIHSNCKRYSRCIKRDILTPNPNAE